MDDFIGKIVQSVIGSIILTLIIAVILAAIFPNLNENETAQAVIVIISLVSSLSFFIWLLFFKNEDPKCSNCKDYIRFRDDNEVTVFYNNPVGALIHAERPYKSPDVRCKKCGKYYCCECKLKLNACNCGSTRFESI